VELNTIKKTLTIIFNIAAGFTYSEEKAIFGEKNMDMGQCICKFGKIEI
jgi:hypothetical protein